MKKIPLLLGAIFFVLFAPALARSESPRAPIKIGFVGSLTSFAGAYGTAVLEGAKIAVEDLQKAGTPVELFVEDDQSIAKNTVLAYQKLRSVNHIDALISGTWWANSIVKTVEKDGIPMISCETLFNKDYIESPVYFSLLGDLRDWVRVFEPLIREKGWKKGGIVKFVSGFAETLKEEMESIFTKDGRSFAKPIEYADIELKEASTVATQLKSMQPDVIYVDAQPQSFAGLMSRLTEQKVGIVILTNTDAHDAYVQRLFDPSKFPGTIYYSSRQTYQPGFKERFTRAYNREPVLDADLGYYGVKLLDLAFRGGGDPLTALKSGGLTVDGIQFSFDEHNIYRGLKQDIYTFKDGAPVQLSNAPD